MILATIFSPANLAVNPNGGTLLFNSGEDITVSTSGISYTPSNQYITCQNATGGNAIPIWSWLINLPIFSSIYDYSASLGAGASAIVKGIVTTSQTGIPQITTSTVSQVCKAQATNILTFKYDGQDIILLFIQLIVVIAGATVLTATVTGVGSYVMFIIGALASIWIVLSAFAYPTFSTIPNPWGASLYTIMTLGYSIGAIDAVGGGKIA